MSYFLVTTVNLSLEVLRGIQCPLTAGAVSLRNAMSSIVSNDGHNFDNLTCTHVEFSNTYTIIFESN